MKFNQFTPEGVTDINYLEFNQKEQVEKSVKKVFNAYEYKQIQTPTFEYYDLFSEIDSHIDKEDMYKILDGDGNILVLKPDATIPIARMLANSHESFEDEIKLMYFTTVFRSANFKALGKREFAQGGIEYFGNPKPEADSEVIKIAIESLKKLGFKQIHIDMGQSEYVNGLLDCIQSVSQRKKIETYIEKKACVDLEVALKSLPIDETYKEGIKALPFMFGDFETTFKKGQSFNLNERTNQGLENLKAIYGILKEEGLTPYVYLDLSLTNQLDYYSGMIFKGYIGQVGEPIVSGGRYDDLMKKFNKNIPGVGFGLNMDRISKANEADTSQDSTLSIALGKGRLAELTIEKLNKAGIDFPDYSKKSRKLIFESSDKKIKIVFVKATDVDIYVEKGACDIGIAGKDTILEGNSDVNEVLDLEYGKCKFCIAALKDFKYNPSKKLTVATKYPTVAKKHFETLGKSIEIIKINGSVELAPIMGLSDIIIDIVETGTTLKENGLVVLEEIEEVSARLISNKVSLKTKRNEIFKILNELQV